ncbi:phage portal protein [Roseomonas mucosa]|uniref:phage portal protein n=1 Tax=Roseomonas mucosa TaxID=207340 RepID=UPI003850E55B
MNLLERAILAISPQRAAARARARVQAQHLMAFEAVQMARRSRDATFRDRGANAELGPALYRLRAASRRLTRDNPYAERAVDILTSHRVGYGFTPRAATGDRDLDKQANAVFAKWAKRADATGVQSFNGLLELQARAWAQDGEGILRLVRLTPAQARARDLYLPLQLEGVEADFVDETRTQVRDGKLVVQGVQVGQGNLREGFWMHRTHPGEAWSGAWMGSNAPNQLDFWPAREVLHLFTQKRFGQQRGYPIFAPVNRRLQQLDEYEDAALEKAKIEACLAAFVTSASAPGEGTVEPTTEGAGKAERERDERISPGMITYLDPGEEIDTVVPTGAGQFSPLATHFLMSVAIGVGVTYDQLTGDLSGATFSSLKAGKIEFRRCIDRDHELRLIPMVCDPVWNAVMDAAVIMGLLPPREGGYPVEWMPPRHEMIDPTREIPATIKSIRAGIETLPQAIASMGYDPITQAEEIAKWNSELDSRGIILDSDPRRVSLSGGAQDQKQNGAVELGAKGRQGGATADDSASD